ncbi:MAG: hypothetical protein ACKPKO_02585, partial [Candidatus Fonsibacter sp.]
MKHHWICNHYIGAGGVGYRGWKRTCHMGESDPAPRCTSSKGKRFAPSTCRRVPLPLLQNIIAAIRRWEGAHQSRSAENMSIP